MNAATIRRLLRLYPQSWRERYEEEFVALLEQQPATFRARADVALGAVVAHCRALRSGKFGGARFSMLDLKLGGRMLVKHPALTVIATIAVAFAIAVGTVGFEIGRQVLWPTIPLPDGSAIIALRNWNVADNAPVSASRRDYAQWRNGLTTITDLSAVDIEERSVAVGAGIGQPETVANVTASTFTMTRVPALLGRTLLPGDERGDAPEVVVVGYDFWKNKLDGAEDVVGRVIRVSGTPVTIVGVMPRGYGFPQANGIWRPLHLERIPEARPSLSYVFGRLAPRYSRKEAVAQAAAIGARSATMFPETHKNVRLQVVALTDAVSYWDDHVPFLLASMNVFLVLLAALLCGNVAMLLFARAVTRERELLVRAALGASRGRLIMQLFAEALVLCVVGAAAGLMVGRFVLAESWAMIEGKAGALPFWIDPSMSTTAMLYALGLSLFATAIAGIVPALKVTSSGAGTKLRAASSGGGGLQFGGVWTVVIVAQIALTTVLPVPLLGVGAGFVDVQNKEAGFAAEEFLTATLAVDRFDGAAASGDTVPAARAARLEAGYRALADRLTQEPGVLGVTYADQLPLMRLRWSAIEADGSPANDGNDHCKPYYCAGVVSVDPRFFDVVGAPMLRGSALTTADAEQKTRTVVVNEFFVKRVLHGRNPIGARFRFAATRESNPDVWYQIVGVVRDLGVSDSESDWGRASVYQARLPRETGTLRVAIHVRGDPQRFATRLRELAQTIDPALRVIDPKPLPRLGESAGAFWLELLLTLTSVTLMLSLAGVYAVTAFAVAKRTREIGVRVALGAQPLHVLTTVFKRPLVQIALGIGVGGIMALLILNQGDVADVRIGDLARAALFALSTVVCCVLACVVPTRRALRVQPTDALRDEG